MYSIDESGNIEEFVCLRAAGRAMTGNPSNSGSKIGRAIQNGTYVYGRKWFYKDMI